MLIQKIILSFNTENGKGLPLANLTSQILVNVHMNKFDQFIKHELKLKYYVRYADDFIILSDDKKYLENLLVQIKSFFDNKLKLALHPNKVFIKTCASGIDFLGWIHFTDHRVIRTFTKKRGLKNVLGRNIGSNITQSYLGLLKYGNRKKIAINIENIVKT